jgi:hypothetical protein
MVLRGGRQGSGANSLRDESYERRLDQVPKADRWTLSSLENSKLYGAAGVPASYANVFVFVHLDRMYERFTGYECRIRVTTAVASSTFRAAIYSFKGQDLTMVPGSSVLFSTAATGLITEKCSFDLVPGVRYFMAYMPTSASVRLRGATSTIGTIESNSQMTADPANPPTHVNFRGLTAFYNGDFPEIVYFSQEAAKWL